MRVRNSEDYGINTFSNLSNVHDLHPDMYAQPTFSEWAKEVGYKVWRDNFYATHGVDAAYLVKTTGKLPEIITLIWYLALIGRIGAVYGLIRGNTYVNYIGKEMLEMYAQMSGDEQTIYWVKALPKEPAKVCEFKRNVKH